MNSTYLLKLEVTFRSGSFPAASVLPYTFLWPEWRGRRTTLKEENRDDKGISMDLDIFNYETRVFWSHDTSASFMNMKNIT